MAVTYLLCCYTDVYSVGAGAAGGECMYMRLERDHEILDA